MFTDLLTMFQSMNSTTLTILFGLCGGVYFIYLKPTLQHYRELQKLQQEKIEQIPTPEDITRLMDTMVNIVTTSVKDSISVLDVVDKKIDEIRSSVDALSQDLQAHVDEETIQNDQQTEVLVDLITDSKSIEALIEHLMIELAKSEMIAPVDDQQIRELKNRVADTKVNLNLIMAMFNRHMKVPQNKKTKLNRVMQTRT